MHLVSPKNIDIATDPRPLKLKNNTVDRYNSAYHHNMNPGKETLALSNESNRCVVTTSVSGSRGGCRNRNYVKHQYRDHYYDPIFTGETYETTTRDSIVTNKPLPQKGPSGGVIKPFPIKLHELLSQVEKEDIVDIVSWQPHGRCFVIHQPRRFAQEVMSRHFNQSKFTSFQRQLNIYGFLRLTKGADRGGYYHELFLRGRQDLCGRMIRMKIKGNGTKPAPSPDTEPQFYSMESCAKTASSTLSGSSTKRLSSLEDDPKIKLRTEAFSETKVEGSTNNLALAHGKVVDREVFSAALSFQSIASALVATDTSLELSALPCPPRLHGFPLSKMNAEENYGKLLDNDDFTSTPSLQSIRYHDVSKDTSSMYSVFPCPTTLQSPGFGLSETDGERKIPLVSLPYLESASAINHSCDMLCKPDVPPLMSSPSRSLSPEPASFGEKISLRGVRHFYCVDTLLMTDFI